MEYVICDHRDECVVLACPHYVVHRCRPALCSGRCLRVENAKCVKVGQA